MNLRHTAALALVVLIPLFGCADGNSPSYADKVLNRPMPADETARIQECNWVRSEIARQQGNQMVEGAMTSKLVPALLEGHAQQNIAALEARAANVRCTAAFSNVPVSIALVGWYLSVPPPKASGGADLGAPLGRWQIATSFDSAADCESALRKYQAMLPQQLHDNAKNKQFVEWATQSTPAALCVATDDPRLKVR
jgi:hypothetical protein